MKEAKEEVLSCWTYMVRCSDGSLYTGWTKDLEKRVKAHNGQAPGGAKYTRNKRPVILVWCQAYASKEEAQSREYWIKKASKKEKEALVDAYGKLQNKVLL